MERDDLAAETIDARIARRLKDLRTERGWSLDELHVRSGVSRSTLSRRENAEVSPTAAVLSRLAAAHGLSISLLIRMAEDDAIAVVPRDAQTVWVDPAHEFRRRQVSPPARDLAGEVIECELGRDVRIAYDTPPRVGLEHHLLLLDGALEIAVDGRRHLLRPGDCLRYRLTGASAFATPPDSGARYLIFLV